MESKVNINPYKPPQFKKQPNASFEKAKIQDLNRITELYTIFKTMDYEEIMAVIETNEILNFKTDKGEKLIFALLNNPSSTLNESKIKNIIELLVVKNVSINAMNEFNQNVLHLACKKGYFLVIDYLLSLKCNRELVDNYGNAPIHYVIEEFIRDCKGGEMYNYKNSVF
jgi:ankyrin repeat protein